MHTKQEILEKFCINMNKYVQENRVILIGRELEMRMMMQSLCRIKKNNLLLIGHAGVGKTVLVQGLAFAINNNNVPDFLQNKVIYSLNINSLTAGTKMRGELEERLEKIFNAAYNSTNIILFIDEIHTIVKKQEESGDLSNIFKTHLTEYNFRVIGATTINEYQKYLEPEKALKRRFNLIHIKEPSINETLTIIRGIKEQLERFYGITIQDKAIQIAAELSSKYFVDLKNPDKTIDIIDETASRLNFNTQLEPKEIYTIKDQIDKIKLEIASKKIDADTDKHKIKNIQNLQENIKKLEKDYFQKQEIWHKEKEIIQKTKYLKNKIDELKTDANQFQREGRFTEASKIYYVDIQNLKYELEELNKNIKFRYVKSIMIKEDVLNTISEQTGIPMHKLTYDITCFKNFITYLKTSIIGQDEAIKQISQQLQLTFSAFREHNQPLCSLFLTGPTGVGKTETAKQICYFLFGENTKINILNMSQYKEAHTVASLIGAPPGYIGYQEEGILTSIPRKRPYQVILLDEIEKAHQNVFDVLLPILDTGKTVDQKGAIADFRETIIIVTSNIILDQNNIDNVNYKKLEQYFKPEFINRFDSIVVYKELNKFHFENIIQQNIDKYIKSFYNEQGIKIIVESNVIKYLSRNIFSEKYGAREIKRQIKKQFIYPIINKIMEEITSKTKRKNISKILVDISTGLMNIKLFF